MLILLLNTQNIEAKRSKYFYSGIGVTANLGPGSTLLNSKTGTFHSGNMQIASNQSVLPGPAPAGRLAIQRDQYAPARVGLHAYDGNITIKTVSVPPNYNLQPATLNPITFVLDTGTSFNANFTDDHGSSLSGTLNTTDHTFIIHNYSQTNPITGISSAAIVGQTIRGIDNTIPTTYLPDNATLQIVHKISGNYDISSVTGGTGSLKIESIGVPARDTNLQETILTNLLFTNSSTNPGTYTANFTDAKGSNFSMNVTPDALKTNMTYTQTDPALGTATPKINNQDVYLSKSQDPASPDSYVIEKQYVPTDLGDREDGDEAVNTSTVHSIYGTLTPSLRNFIPAPTPTTEVIDFSNAEKVKNKTGLSYMFGLTSQYVTETGVTLGFSVNYGRTGNASTVNYNTGSVQGTTFQKTDPIAFSMKDKGYVSELIQLGYAYNRFNPYFIFGLAQHKAKLWCPGASDVPGTPNASGASSVSKSYNTPLFGLGLNVAINKNAYFTLQWQRHVGSVKNWGKIDNTLPQGYIPMGSPQMRFGNSMILLGVTYLTTFSGKR